LFQVFVIMGQWPYIEKKLTNIVLYFLKDTTSLFLHFDKLLTKIETKIAETKILFETLTKTNFCFCFKCLTKKA